MYTEQHFFVTIFLIVYSIISVWSMKYLTMRWNISQKLFFSGEPLPALSVDDVYR